MNTVNQITREQTEQLALRLLEKTKDRIMSGRPYKSIHAVALRLTPIMVQRNFDALYRKGTTMKAPTKTIELRKIHHSASLSEETYAYSADVYVDGKRFCTVSNHGYGGPDEHHPVAPFTHKDVEDLDAWVKSNIPPVDCSDLYNDGEKHTLEMSLELYCHERVSDFLTEKDLKRILKSKMAWVENGKLWYVKMPKNLIGEQRTKWYGLLKQKYAHVTFLNNMPFPVALSAYKTVKN